jgi:hypothetical protein
MIEEDERPYHPGRECGQQTLHGEAAEVAATGIEDLQAAYLFRQFSVCDAAAKAGRCPIALEP